MDKKTVAKMAKEMNDALFGSNKDGAFNVCKQTAYKGQPSIRVIDTYYSDSFDGNTAEIADWMPRVKECANETVVRLAEIEKKAREYAEKFGGTVIVIKKDSKIEHHYNHDRLFGKVTCWWIRHYVTIRIVFAA